MENAVKASLKDCVLFKTFDDFELEVLMVHGQLKKISAGKILYMKGEESNDTFCLIISGNVDIVGKGGQIVREMGSSEVIGEIALSDPNRARTVNVITKTSTEILEWNVNNIRDKIPGLWKKLLKLAWRHISEYYEE